MSNGQSHSHANGTILKSTGSAAVEANVSLDDARVHQAMEDYLKRLTAGERPDRDALLRRYADVAEALAICLQGLDFVHAAGAELSHPVAGAGDGEATEPPECLGDFRIVREVGRGGMGVVYEAQQISLGRRVALKVLPFAAALDARQLQRFKNEAQAAAYLQHQNIVPVYFVGCDRGVHYYAMQFIEGHSLADIIEQLRQERGGEALDPDVTAPYSPSPSSPAVDSDGMPVPVDDEVAQVVRAETAAGSATPVSGLSQAAYFTWVARVGEQAALALEHAHQQGVLHRDIKPANLMLDSRGNVWVTDFGLAHLPGDQRLTMTGDLLGTLRYMSPEQALAQRVGVDHRTDIYSLGVTLYELLTLQAVYAGHDRQELLNQIAFKEPRRLRKIDKAIPTELETIVLKAMEKVPGDRYSTAQELAEDLRRYLTDQPIRARRPSIALRLRKWGRRHKPAVTAAVVLLILAVVGLSIGSWLLWQEKRRANEGWSRAEERLGFSYEILDELWMDVAENQLIHKASLTPEDRQFLVRMRTLYWQVAEQGGDTPATRLRTARAYRRIADVQQLLGELSQSVQAYDGAIELLDRVVAEDPQSRPYRTELALAHFHKGLSLADPEGGQEQFGQPADPARALQRPALFSSSSATEFRTASQLFEQLAIPGSPSDHVLDWAKCESELARQVPTRNESLALLRHAEDLLGRAHFAKPAESADARLRLARCEYLLSYYLPGYTEKVEKLRHAIALYEQLYVGAPDDLDCVLGLQRSRLDLAQLLAEQDDREPGDKANRKAVEQLTKQALTSLEKYTKAMPAVPMFLARLWCSRNMLGLLLFRERNWPEAERQFGLALEVARKLEAEHPVLAGGHHCTGCVFHNLGCLYLDYPEHRDPAKALAYAQEAVKRERGNINFRSGLGEAYFRTGQCRAAVPLLLEVPAFGFLTADQWLLLSMVHWRLGEKAQARCWYRLADEYMAIQKLPAAKDRALRDEAAALLGMSPPSKPADDAESARDFQEMGRNIPAALPRRITRPFDRYEALIYADALNTLAWACATSPNASLRDPERAVRLAHYATTVMPREGFYVNTLGVAHYRAGHWKEATAVLARSMQLQKGALEAFDTFFLAMTHWQLGEKEKARRWYDRAVQWTETHGYQWQGNTQWAEELPRFRAEAAELLGIQNTHPAKKKLAAGP